MVLKERLLWCIYVAEKPHTWSVVYVENINFRERRSPIRLSFCTSLITQNSNMPLSSFSSAMTITHDITIASDTIGIGTTLSRINICLPGTESDKYRQQMLISKMIAFLSLYLLVFANCAFVPFYLSFRRFKN